MATAERGWGAPSADFVGGVLPAAPIERADHRAQVRPHLGITYLPLNAQVTPQYGLDVHWGILITAVAEASPATGSRSQGRGSVSV